MKKSLFLPAAFIVACALHSCANNETKSSAHPDSSTTTSASGKTTGAGVVESEFGETDGKKVSLYTLTNNNGVQVKITNYGGIVTSWMTPDINNKMSDVVLGFSDLKGYLGNSPYFGAVIGRYGNRIGDAKFSVDGIEYKLAANDGKNHLHGGKKGFDKVVWAATPSSGGTPALSLSYTSKDGEEGYPGNLKVNVKYTLTDNNELMIEYDAETDKATPVNLTNHSYFNLSGDVANTILDEKLWVDADRYTPVDKTLIPTGELKPVKGTPFDFTTEHKIGERIGQVPGGYDHNFVLNKSDSSLKLVAYVTDSLSGRKLEVSTTEPGIQFYTGNFLNGSLKTSDGKAINKNTALCLETQHFPDSPNKPSFPTTILRPGQKYHTATVYKIFVSK
jgi:aldose 1-epimerase